MSGAATFAEFWPEYVRAHSRFYAHRALRGTLLGWMTLGAVCTARWCWIPLLLYFLHASVDFSLFH